MMSIRISLPLLAMLFSVLSGCTPEALQLITNGLNARNRANQQSFSPSSGGNASNREATSETVCVKYQTQAGWSQGYQVNGTIAKGSYLNRSTSSYDYQPYSTYVVVFWRDSQASVLRLDYFSGALTAYGHAATDQNGRQWNVSKTSYCF